MHLHKYCKGSRKTNFVHFLPPFNSQPNNWPNLSWFEAMAAFSKATPQLCAYAAAAGMLSHWTYFIHGEHHRESPQLLIVSVALPILAYLGLRSCTSLGAAQAAALTAELVGSYSTALWSSILLYRVFFHRLTGFPGPFMARASKLWHVWKLAPKSDNFILLDKLHKQYGDYVRTGKPVEIICQRGCSLCRLRINSIPKAQTKYPSSTQRRFRFFSGQGLSAPKPLGTMRMTLSYQCILSVKRQLMMLDAVFGIVGLVLKVADLFCWRNQNCV
jgi:hypothetical protein